GLRSTGPIVRIDPGLDAAVFEDQTGLSPRYGVDNVRPEHPGPFVSPIVVEEGCGRLDIVDKKFRIKVRVSAQTVGDIHGDVPVVPPLHPGPLEDEQGNDGDEGEGLLLV